MEVAYLNSKIAMGTIFGKAHHKNKVKISGAEADMM